MRGLRRSPVPSSRRSPLAILLAVGALLLSTLAAPVLTSVAPAAADVVKYANDDRGTGWYPDQTGLTPATVSSGNFGRIWDTALNGSVFAQPLVVGNTVFVGTMSNWIYGLNATTGAINWSRYLGPVWNAQDLGCPDASGVGVLGTPVVDAATNRAYFFRKTYANGTSGPGAYFAHGIDLGTGAELPGFPVAIIGSAANDPNTPFNPTTELQRPGLILHDGVFYAAFGGLCDHPIYQGWIVGVSTTGRISTMWTNMPNQEGSPGGGIWQSGGGLISDTPGQFLFASGNGYVPNAPVAGKTPPNTLGNAMTRVVVQPDKTLKATDFFMPYDAPALNDIDADLGSGAPILLPPQHFGTQTYPNLALLSGKQGYLYVMNANDLGGYQQGPSGSDKVINRLGQFGGLWSKPAAWPGNGGYVYMVPSQRPMVALKYGLDGSGKPTFSKVGETADSFGFRSGSPVVSSVGTTSGSALVWTIWNGDLLGKNAQLRAYDPVPVNGVVRLRWSFPIGTSAKFTSPVIDNNRVFIGTGDGRVQMFSYPTDSLFDSASVSFPRTTVNTSATQSLVLTAKKPVTVTGFSTSSTAITTGTPSATLPVSLNTGDTLTVPVTFTPGSVRIYAETVTATTNSVPISFGVSGTGQYATARLEPDPNSTHISFGGVALGSSDVTASVTLRNTGAQPATITGVNLPSLPFQINGAPTVGSVLDPGDEITATAVYKATSLGLHADEFSVTSTGGTAEVSLSGITGTPPQLSLSSTLVTPPDSIELGRPVKLSVTLTNTGGTALIINRSKPPTKTGFSVVDYVPEGEVLQAGESVTASVMATPRVLGQSSDVWEFNGNDGGGVRTVTFRVTGVAAATPTPITGAGWTRNGETAVVGSEVVLTTAAKTFASGNTMWTHPVAMRNLVVSFDMYSGQPGKAVGGEGIAFFFGEVDQVDVNQKGLAGNGFGFGGIAAQGICFDTYQNPRKEISGNFVAACTPMNGVMVLRGAKDLASPMRNNTRRVTIAFGEMVGVVSMDGVPVAKFTFPNLSEFATIGFGASTGPGNHLDIHKVSNVSITNVAENPTLNNFSPRLGGWQMNGEATPWLNGFKVTNPSRNTLNADTVGSVFYGEPLTGSITAEFDVDLRGQSAGGATTFAMLDADRFRPFFVGGPGSGQGWSGGSGVIVSFDTVKNLNDPSNNFIGITNSSALQPTWLATTTSIPNLRAKTYRARVTVTPTQITVSLDGVQVLQTAVTVPTRYFPGFTASRGLLRGAHVVDNIAITRN
ncbi:MAG: PQQ-binding-like beta-propeller repeat protein [Acidobacteria bacterium]|nr:PQQ-binding-like beta-propeller repeat protein [Acidobacteriota bacterium]